MIGHYGEPPVDLGPLDLPEWQEFMHYLYLPVRIPLSDYPDPEGEPERAFGMRFPQRRDDAAVPPRLAFLNDAISAAWTDAIRTAPHLSNPYVYVTARRGFATPGNPLNRPGWHCDDFGGSDLNYIWSDRYPTRFLTTTGTSRPLDLPEDDQHSMRVMQRYADAAEEAGGYNPRVEVAITDGPTGHLLRLSPYVIHDTPLIPEPGGMRSFFKISVSTHRYNLLGNSHNHLLDYEWKMYDRAEVRNRPQGGNSDYVTEETADA